MDENSRKGIGDSFGELTGFLFKMKRNLFLIIFLTPLDCWVGNDGQSEEIVIENGKVRGQY